MSAQVTVQQTPTGWHLVVTEADEVVVDTDGAKINVAIHPDEPDQSATPMAVTLA